jgi:hypothetical protein
VYFLKFRIFSPKKNEVNNLNNQKPENMKPILTLALFAVLSTSIMAAETLSFQFANPRITYSGGTNFFKFDLLMKATANGTYLYSSQIICNVNYANFNITVPPTFTKGTGLLSGDYTPEGGDPTTRYTTTLSWASNNLNIAIYSNVALNGELPSSGAYSEVTTSWQLLGTVTTRISNSTGIAGINFKVAAINGYQKFATGIGPLYSDYYTNPNQYEGYDFTDLYLARMYCGTSGWSQVGLGAGADWNATVNTSVWDIGTGAATVGDATHPNAMADNVRIHLAGKLSINPNTTLTVANMLINNASTPGLLIKSDASGTGSLMHNTDNVPATIQRYITGNPDLTLFNYHFVSVPLTQSENPTSNLFLGSYLFDFMESSNLWHPMGGSTTNSLSSNKGYMIYSPGTSITYSFVGKMNNGAFTVPVTKNGQGYNLVPNPYPSAIDWDAASGWTRNGDMAAATYIWPSTAGASAGQGNYAVYVSPGSFINGGSRYIAQGQSFFVHLTSTPTGFGMNNNVRVHNPVAFLKDNEIIPNILRIKTVARDATDEIVVRFSETASAGFDGQEDAYKLTGGADAPQLNSVATDNSRLCINSLPFNSNETIVPLDFSFNATADVTFTASGIETFAGTGPIYLEDGLTGTKINLRENPVYTFGYEAGSDVNRFKLHFAKVVGTGEYQEPTEGNAFLADRKLFIEVPSMQGQVADVGVYNTLGQLVGTNRVSIFGLTETPFQFPAGLYIVRVTSRTQVFVTKLVTK